MSAEYTIRKKKNMEAASSVTVNLAAVNPKTEGSLPICADRIGSEDVWADVEALKVTHFPWNTCELKPGIVPSEPETAEKKAEFSYSSGIYIPQDCIPDMQVKLFYTQDRFRVCMDVYEKYPRATYHKINDPVCMDSCQEFFFQPCPEEDGRYFNFEINPWGTYLLGIGYDRHNLEIIDESISAGLFSVKNDLQKTSRNREPIFYWRIEFTIPFSFITRYFKTFEAYSGRIMRGNFYKCGDHTLYPHFGCWNEVINDVPDFHRPESFGKLILE